MHTFMNKTLTAFVLLLTLVGQAMALTTAPCSMAVPDESQSAHLQEQYKQDQHIESSHSEHAAYSHHAAETEVKTMAEAHSQSSSHDDCCQQNSSCPMSACAAAASLSAFSVITVDKALELVVQQSTSQAESQIPTSLFRPPIFA